MATEKYQRFHIRNKNALPFRHNWQFLLSSFKTELRAALGSVLGLGSHSEQDTLVNLVMREAGDQDGDNELTMQEINMA